MTQTPFLSIVTRTQGKRPHTLAEMFASLEAQTDQDFEILLIMHRPDVDGRKIVQQIVETLSERLRDKIRLMEVADGNRTKPLNAGFDSAKGEYITILDDDDVVLPQWVSVFRKLASAAPGTVLRAVSRLQRVSTVIKGGLPVLSIEGPLEAEFPDEFNFLDHLLSNRTPPLALAFPRVAIRSLNLRFDETLTTTEDWDFLMRCAAQIPVTSTAEVTSIYRWWQQGESSRTMHSETEWKENHKRIQEQWNIEGLTLPPGTVADLLSRLSTADKTVTENHRLRAGLQALRYGNLPVFVPWSLVPPEPVPDAETIRREIEAILNSKSWRVSAPLRWVSYFLRHRAALPPMNLDNMPAEALARILFALENSFSWRVTAPLRSFRLLQKSGI